VLTVLFACIHVSIANLNHMSVQAGTVGGLYLHLYVNQNDYFFTASSSAGFRVNLNMTLTK